MIHNLVAIVSYVVNSLKFDVNSLLEFTHYEDISLKGFTFTHVLPFLLYFPRTYSKGFNFSKYFNEK